MSELGQVRSGIQFQKLHTPQSMEGSLLSVPNSFNMSEQVLRQGGGVIASSGGSGGNNTYSGINIRGNTGNRTANYTGAPVNGTRLYCHLCHQRHKRQSSIYCIINGHDAFG